MPNLLTKAGFIQIFCSDLDGKWEEEVIKVNNWVYNGMDRITFKVYSPNLYTGLGSKYTRTLDFSTLLTDADGGKSIHPKFYYPGDFNGDGKMKIFAVSNQSLFGWTATNSICYLFDLEANKKLYESYVFPYIKDFAREDYTDSQIIENNSDKLFVLDYDGDGKSDICLINDEG